MPQGLGIVNMYGSATQRRLKVRVRVSVLDALLALTIAEKRSNGDHWGCFFSYD